MPIIPQTPMGSITSAAKVRAQLPFVSREGESRTSTATLAPDAATQLRMPTRTKLATRLVLEDALDSPLAPLDIVSRVDAQTRHAAPAVRSDLPLPIFAFAITDLLEATDAPQFAIEDLRYSHKSRCFPAAPSSP